MAVIDAARKRLANQRQSAQLYRKQTATARPDFSRSQQFEWRTGDIAFLKPESAFSNLDKKCLIDSKYLPSAATCHPVIILERRSEDASHVLVTTVSAYGCTSRDDSNAPWRQRCHREKDLAAFRSFVGSERPNADRPLLRLQGGRLMPKPEASWVYLGNVYVVPITVLGTFNKAPIRLRMEAADLLDLRVQFSQQTHFGKEIRSDPRLTELIHGNTIVRKPIPTTQQAPGPRPVVAAVPATIRTGGVPRRAAWQNNSWASVAVRRPVAVA
ncbi:hypothetical protein CMUS01_07900 [Colletotrichum musicola]|uniref:Uncharacterized protein n=1 Tax=Colletotrichum musicola TaxID=2175873 RepID=A0A8H6KEY8_9PEZI|nr:hypothetical protein CMUS01_07900 [Colletotrichum musicola]